MSSHFSPHWSEITAVMGGSYDPPHMGHREAARGLFSEPGVQRVVVMPAGQPPGKSPNCSPAHRLEMVRLNFQSQPGESFPSDIQIDTREIERLEKSPHSPSYTFFSLQELGHTYRNLAFVVGSDQLVQLHTWYRFPELLSLSHWIVLERKQSSEQSGATDCRKILAQWQASGMIRPSPSSHTWMIPHGNKFLSIFPTNAPEISSTSIRENLARSGSVPEGALFPPVFSYLKQNRLYGI